MKKGIDVSYCQDGMDFNAAAAAGATFCIVRAGRLGDSGARYLDTSFISNINGAIAAGMKVGLYFYTKAMTVEQAAGDAAFMAAVIEEYCRGTDLAAGVWYDVEDGETTGTCDNETITAICSRFICEMNDAGIKNVGIYSFYDWLANRIDTDELADYVPYWPASRRVNYFAAENPGKIVPIWQCANNWTDDVNSRKEIVYDGNIMYEDGDDPAAPMEG